MLAQDGKKREITLIFAEFSSTFLDERRMRQKGTVFGLTGIVHSSIFRREW
jgi:hypothetical protein